MTGLEHDEDGHPSGNPAMHAKMTARRREKIKALGAELAAPEVFGDEEGDGAARRLGLDLGSDPRGGRRACAPAASRPARSTCATCTRCPPASTRFSARYRHIFVVEMNDEGLYGFGQLAMLLRARYANPAIRSITKTDGLTFKVREIVDGVAHHLDPTASSRPPPFAR